MVLGLDKGYFDLLKYVVLMIARHEGNFWKSINSVKLELNSNIFVIEDLLIVTMLLSSGISFSVVEN